MRNQYSQRLLLLLMLTFGQPVERNGASLLKISSPQTASKSIFEQLYVASFASIEGHIEGI